MSLYPKIGDSFYLSSDDEVDNGDGFDFGGGLEYLGEAGQSCVARRIRCRKRRHV